MLRILNAEPLDYCDEAREVLRTIGELSEYQLDRAELLALISEYNVVIVRLGFQIDREILDAGTRLKAVLTATTGLDHIDVSYASQRGVEVLSLQGESDYLRSIPATAEHTWALLLSLLRRIPQAVNSVRVGEWDRDALRGNDLFGKNLGIVGLGRIGEKVARYGLAFGMKVGAYDPHRSDWLREITYYSSLQELLEDTEILSLHVPLNSETIGLIGDKEFASLQKGAFLINTSRGAVLDEIALVKHLEGDHLAGAALDVIMGERDHESLVESPLLVHARSSNNLLITPHIGGATRESMAKTELFMAEKLKRWVEHIEGAPSP